MVGGSNGYRAVLVRRQLTPGLISSLRGMAKLPLFTSFSISYPKLDSAMAYVNWLEDSADDRGRALPLEPKIAYSSIISYMAAAARA